MIGIRMAIAMLLIAAVAGVAGALTIRRAVISAGGGRASASEAAVLSTLGQPLAGEVSGQSHSAGSGFWGLPDGGPVVDVELPDVAPTTFGLVGVVPNPLRTLARIAFDIPHPVNDAQIGVFDASGRLVRVLTSGPRVAGRHVVAWDGRDRTGNAVASGSYYVRMDSAGYARTTRVVVLR